MTFADELKIRFTVETPERVEAELPVEPRLYQPFGFLHGGVTLSLLESVASWGSQFSADLETELPFGVQIDVRHRKSVQRGMLRGVAVLDREEPSRTAGRKQYWNVTAYDDEGDVVSEGVFVCKIVPKAYLAEKERRRREERAGR